MRAIIMQSPEPSAVVPACLSIFETLTHSYTHTHTHTHTLRIPLAQNYPSNPLLAYQNTDVKSADKVFFPSPLLAAVCCC